MGPILIYNDVINPLRPVALAPDILAFGLLLVVPPFDLCGTAICFVVSTDFRDLPLNLMTMAGPTMVCSLTQKRPFKTSASR